MLLRQYQRIRFEGIIREALRLEVTRSNVRRDLMRHIELAAPVTHICHFKGVPSRLACLPDRVTHR